MNGNRLRHLDGDCFKSLKELETLQLAKQPELIRLPVAESFAQLVQLQHLHLYDMPQVSNYNISEILRYLPPLRTLHFQLDTFILDKQLVNADLRLMNEIAVSGKKLKMVTLIA